MVGSSRLLWGHSSVFWQRCDFERDHPITLSASHLDHLGNWGIPWWVESHAVGSSVTLHIHPFKSTRLFYCHHASGTTPLSLPTYQTRVRPSASVVLNSREHRGSPINPSTLQFPPTTIPENKVTLCRWWLHAASLSLTAAQSCRLSRAAG